MNYFEFALFSFTVLLFIAWIVAMFYIVRVNKPLPVNVFIMFAFAISWLVGAVSYDNLFNKKPEAPTITADTEDVNTGISVLTESNEVVVQRSDAYNSFSIVIEGSEFALVEIEKKRGDWIVRVTKKNNSAYFSYYDF